MRVKRGIPLQSWIYLAFFFGQSVYKAFWTFLFEVSLTTRLFKTDPNFLRKNDYPTAFEKKTNVGP